MQQECMVNGQPYTLLRLLGKGKGGYSFLAQRAGQLVVVKQIHHEPCAYYTFGNKMEAETGDYARLQAAGIPVPQMLDADMANECIVKEYIDGPTIFDLVRAGAMQEDYLRQGWAMAEQAQAAGLNIDYFPTNFVVQDGRLYYVDYECNLYMEEWSFRQWGVKYWSQTEEFLAYVREHG